MNTIRSHRSGLAVLAFLGICASLFACAEPASADPGLPSPSLEYEFTYRMVVRDIPENSEQIRIWVPIPRDDARQSVSALQIESPFSFTETVEPEYGNRYLYCELTDGVPDSLPFEMTFRVRRTEASALTPADTGVVLDRLLERFLAADALVPIDGAVAAEADSVAGDLETEAEKARALYDHIVGTMRYDKSGTGWGNGDAIFACEERRGNCTDIHSLLIGMARALNVPARFVVGFPIPPDAGEGTIGGYHCWADLFIPERGWVPVDASEAVKHPKKTGYYFGHLDQRRIAFTIGRDISLDPADESIAANYFIYPYVRLDGRDYTNVSREFRFRVIETPVERGATPAPASGQSGKTQ